MSEAKPVILLFDTEKSPVRDFHWCHLTRVGWERLMRHLQDHSDDPDLSALSQLDAGNGHQNASRTFSENRESGGDHDRD